MGRIKHIICIPMKSVNERNMPTHWQTSLSYGIMIGIKENPAGMPDFRLNLLHEEARNHAAQRSQFKFTQFRFIPLFLRFPKLIRFFFQIILPAKLAFLQQPLVILISLLRQVFWLFLIRQAEFPFRDQPYRLCSENRNGFTVAARSPAPDQSADRFCYISRQETGLSLRQAA